jgi:hypothetical protein
LIFQKDPETLARKNQIVSMLLDLLKHDDPYIFLLTITVEIQKFTVEKFNVEKLL